MARARQWHMNRRFTIEGAMPTFLEPNEKPYRRASSTSALSIRGSHLSWLSVAVVEDWKGVLIF